MSLCKRRNKKSLNSSASDISQTDHFRPPPPHDPRAPPSDNLSIFHNGVLSEIKNIRVYDSANSKKEVLQRKGTKVQERYSSTKENKIHSYSSLSKVVEDRDAVIDTQERQIENLKMALQKVRKELDFSRVDFEKKKLEDLSLLKQQERENEENLKELQVLKAGLKQMKGKLEQMQIENAKLARKNSEYLNENEELTVRIASLKQELHSESVEEAQLSDLRQQLHVLKEQAKITKQLENHKACLEQKCRNFEKKINEYILKYNELQGEYNESQIRYYRAQKDNDDLKLAIEGLETSKATLECMLSKQRLVLAEQSEKLSNHVCQMQRDERDSQCQTEAVEEAQFMKLQEFQSLQGQLVYKDQKIIELNASIQRLRREVESKQQLYYGLVEQQQIKSSEQSQLEEIVQNKTTYICTLQDKARKLLEENERITGELAETVKMFTIIKDAEGSLIFQIRAFKTEIAQLRENSESLSYRARQLSQQVAQISEENTKKSRELAVAEQETKRQSNKLFQTNSELKKIKQMVCSYQDEIRRLGEQVEEGERSLQNEEYLKKEERLKYEEDISYYKKKYDDLFHQNIELSDKICQIQRENTNQINVHTSILQDHAHLEKKCLELQKRNAVLEKQAKTYSYSESKCATYERSNQALLDKICTLDTEKLAIQASLNESRAYAQSLEAQVSSLKDDKNRIELLMSEKEGLCKQLISDAERKFEYEASKRVESLDAKCSAKQRELEERDRLIQEYREKINSKQREIFQLHSRKTETENEQIISMKSYNVRLAQQIDEVTVQLNRNHLQLDSANEDNRRQKATIQALEAELKEQRQKNMEMNAEASFSHRNSEKETSSLMAENSQLKIRLANVEQRLQRQTEECAEWMGRFEQMSRECRRVQQESSRKSRIQVEESHKKNKESLREVESFKVQLSILQEENRQLKRVMDEQLSKRKGMIEELIEEKKMLYEQLSNR